MHLSPLKMVIVLLVVVYSIKVYARLAKGGTCASSKETKSWAFLFALDKAKKFQLDQIFFLTNSPEVISVFKGRRIGWLEVLWWTFLTYSNTLHPLNFDISLEIWMWHRILWLKFGLSLVWSQTILIVSRTSWTGRLFDVFVWFFFLDLLLIKFVLSTKKKKT